MPLTGKHELVISRQKDLQLAKFRDIIFWSEDQFVGEVANWWLEAVKILRIMMHPILKMPAFEPVKAKSICKCLTIRSNSSTLISNISFSHFVRRILLDIYLYMSHVYNYIISITPSSECWYIYSNMHASPKHFVEINCANMKRFIIPSVSFTTGNIDMSQALSFWMLDSFRLWLQAQVCLLPTDRSSQCMAHRQVMPLEDKTYPTKARAFLFIYAHQAHWMYIVYIPNV